MSKDDDEIDFPSPVLNTKINDMCGKCNACRHACRVKAIDVTVTGVIVDRQACMNVQIKEGGDCFDCVLACRHNVLSMRKFRRKNDGEFIQLT